MKYVFSILGLLVLGLYIGIKVIPELHLERTVTKAEEGDVDAQIEAGRIYLSCQLEMGAHFNTNLCNNSEGFKWYKRAAESGNTAAQNRLGFLYFAGYGTQKSGDQAVLWFQKAAEEGDSQAQYWVGKLYGEGTLIKADYASAIKWYSKAANQGYKYAYENLGLLYAQGTEKIPPNYEEAYFWLSLFSKDCGRHLEENPGIKGFCLREKETETAKSKLTAKQISAVQRRVIEWKLTSAPASK
jgi:uncharacterized protein